MMHDGNTRCVKRRYLKQNLYVMTFFFFVLNRQWRNRRRDGRYQNFTVLFLSEDLKSHFQKCAGHVIPCTYTCLREKKRLNIFMSCTLRA